VGAGKNLFAIEPDKIFAQGSILLGIAGGRKHLDQTVAGDRRRWQAVNSSPNPSRGDSTTPNAVHAGRNSPAASKPTRRGCGKSHDRPPRHFEAIDGKALVINVLGAAGKPFDSSCIIDHVAAHIGSRTRILVEDRPSRRSKYGGWAKWSARQVRLV